MVPDSVSFVTVSQSSSIVIVRHSVECVLPCVSHVIATPGCHYCVYCCTFMY